MVASTHTIGGGSSLPDGEETEMGKHISFAALSKLEANAKFMDDIERLKQHILLCPFVSPDSSAVAAALKGLETTDGSGRVSPVAVSPEDDAVSRLQPTQLDEQVSRVWRNRRGGLSFLGAILRVLLLETPVIALFLLYLTVVWIHRAHDLYLRPMGETLSWADDDKRAVQEMTFYARECKSKDLTTSDPLDLIIPSNASPREAYEHQLEHGMSIFQNVLSEETSTNLRTHIVDYNMKMRDSESIFLISQKNRYSFGLGIERPEVAKAMEEFANHPQMSAALEEILGPNPALIEMSGITSTYGAADQYWHDDVIAEASPIQFGRTFGPSYSVFTQLQNTTKLMGATATCPGSHVCPFGPEKYCPNVGFQVNTTEGFWKVGDSALMNMNTWHRGAAHTDPNAEDRVMLVLTFAPRPNTHAEMRQLSQGITFSLRWDMWGHCLDDMKHAAKAMWRPIAVLRALGLYKRPEADWGIDYITGAIMRMASEDNGFRRDELDVFIERGGFWWIPKYLHGDVDDDENWPEYYLKTIRNCESFLKLASCVSLGVYLALFLVGSLILSPSVGSIGQKHRGRALFRMTAALSLVYTLFGAALYRIDRSQWAHDVREGRMYNVSYDYGESEYLGPTTFPDRNDVLIEQRFGSDYMALYNDFIDRHPGNQRWRRMLKAALPTYAKYPSFLQEAYAAYITGKVWMAEGRLLYQDRHGNWVEMSPTDSIDRTRFELDLASSPVKVVLWKGWRHLLSECKFGHIRDAAMTQDHIVSLLFALRASLFNNELALSKGVDSRSTASKRIPTSFRRTFVLPSVGSRTRYERSQPPLLVGVYPDEPMEGAWIKSGDLIEVRHREDDGPRRWYPATVLSVSSSKFFVVQYGLGQRRAIVKPSNTRRYVLLEIGDRVEVMHNDESFYPGVITIFNEDGTFSVYVEEFETTYQRVSHDEIRRGPKRPVI